MHSCVIACMHACELFVSEFVFAFVYVCASRAGEDVRVSVGVCVCICERLCVIMSLRCLSVCLCLSV